MRVKGLSLAILLCGVLLSGASAFSDDAQPQPAPAPAAKPVDDEAFRSGIQKGLDVLARMQTPQGDIGKQNKLASTSLAGMAFLSGGNFPGRGKYCKNVEMAIRFIVENTATPSGYLQFEASNMYSHGLATLFLAESYGTIPPYMKLQPKVLKVLKKSVDLIEKCQGPEGGWWYDPRRDTSGNGADISVTVMETNALRAAREAGTGVDKRVIENALKCVKIAQNQDGGFCYRVHVSTGNDGGGSLLPRSAGAVCILLALGDYTDVAVKKGLGYLKANTTTGLKPETPWWYYAAYYVSQAYFMSGEENWREWWPRIRDVLLSKQDADGSWQGEGGRGYGTAVALIILQMPYRYLPIYQEGIEGGKTSSSE
jgi:hypothetical protein